MIKRMEGDKCSISMTDQEQIILSVNGIDVEVSVDEYDGINRMLSIFWDVNNLYRETSESKRNRERDEMYCDNGATGQKISARY